MTSPRVLASLLALSVAGVVIASCGDQPSPTVASPVAAPTGVFGAAQTPSLLDMLADPTVPTFTTKAVETYAPGTAFEPWPPGPPPKAQPGVPVPTDPTFSPRMHIVIDPEPVTHSGVPVPTVSCATNHPYTWYYDQVFEETSGAAVTLSSRVDFFDGFSVNIINGINIQVPAKGKATIKARWCSGNAIQHTAQSTFSGVDEKGNAITVNTPAIRLMAP